MLLNQFSSALDALAALSAIFSEKGRPLNADEDALAAEIAKKFSACAEWLSAQPESERPLAGPFFHYLCQ
jgi:hypothetical protein